MSLEILIAFTLVNGIGNQVSTIAFSPKSSAISKPDAEVLEQLMPPMKGMTLNAWSYEAYSSPECDQSLSNLAATKANWVLLTDFWFMNTTSDVEIHPRPDLYTASDSSLIHAIQKGQELGMNVTLKPMVDVADGNWRGVINPSNWTLWFQNYQSFINHFADIAETNNVTLLVVGTELKSSQQYEANWRAIISEVRLRFSGELTYAANWDSYSPGSWIKFWDALDYVGVDAYFPLTSSYNPTLSQLITAWSSRVTQLSSVSTQTGKKILFTEIGYCSQNGTNIQPWNWEMSTTIDLQEQADCYQAALEVFKSKTWFEGWFWWNWETDPNAGGPTERHYTPQNKPAQSILHMAYDVPPDVAVAAIECSKDSAVEGEIVAINVTVENQGTYTDAFNVTVYANSTTIQTEGITIENGSFAIVDVSWNTSGFAGGNYQIRAYAPPHPFEIDTLDNSLNDGWVAIGIHDVAVTLILPSKDVICLGYSMNFTVTVENQGSYSELIDVTLYLNNSLIGSSSINLAKGNVSSIVFVWNTAGSIKGKYRVLAAVTEVLGEQDVADNLVLDGFVTVTMLGDIAPQFGVVDIFDIVTIATAFGSTPSSPNWNRNADINNDRIIDIFDITVVALHFGEVQG